jgi:hypothetical protein
VERIFKKYELASKTNIIFGLILSSVVWMDCSTNATEDKNQKDIFVIDSQFPLDLDKIDLTDTTNFVQVNDEIKSRIEQTFRDYYKEECVNDSLADYWDTYINTIRLSDSLQTIYVVLLKNYPTEELTAKVLFYDNLKNELIEDKFDFRIYALYGFENNKLKSSDLKSMLRIEISPIELVDFDNDGLNDFKFTRLFHNGTFNSIQTAILTVRNYTLDTLDFKEEVIE